MFQKARVKLTLWYLLIIMLVSIAFSFSMYHILTQELNRVERIQRLRQEGRLSLPQLRNPRVPSIDPEVIEETKKRLRATLILINFGILAASALAGYFLAGRTLRPIKEMVDEQGRFITDSSHELRTPLTSLKSEIEVNLRDKKLNLNMARKLLESNLEEVNNLQYLSDNLIKLTQYQKSNGSKFTEVNLLDVIFDAQKKVASLAKNKKITIKNNIEDQIILGDKQSLIEMFVIFLDNAIKYSNKGKTITLSAENLNNLIQISIQDQGMGISEKDIPQLFDRFYRADKSRTKSETSGYGLGLSIARQILDRHNGFVEVESVINKGTTFKLFLRLPG